MDDQEDPHKCPTCGASSRERLLMQAFSVVISLVEFFHHIVK